MAASTVRKTKRDTTITLTDGAGSPNTLALTLDRGDLSASIPGPNIVRDDPRGVIGATPALRKGNDRPMSVSFTARVADFSDGTDEILTDWALKDDFGAGWTSTLDASGNAEVLAIHVDVGVEGTDHGDSADHSFRLPHCTGEWELSEGADFWELSFSGTSHSVRPSALA